MKKYFLTLTALGCLCLSSYGQEMKLPAPSPLATTKQDFSTSFIEIKYSRPSVRGRKIFGQTIPYNAVWRTGANAATTLTFGEEVSIKGHVIPAGTYALYSVPGEKEWKIIINKGVGNWGVSGFDDKDDVAVFNVPVQKMPETLQTFSIDIQNLGTRNCDIVLAWENTKVVLPVVADNDKKITEYLENAIHQPKLPYQQAANYYLETGQQLDKALGYADLAIKENPNAFWLYWLKARICQKLGKKDEALKAARKSAEMASKTPYAQEYQRNAEQLEAELKK